MHSGLSQVRKQHGYEAIPGLSDLKARNLFQVHYLPKLQSFIYHLHDFIHICLSLALFLVFFLRFS